MNDRLEQAMNRLQRLAEKAEREGSGMDIPDIVGAIVGSEYDEGLEELVSLAMESSEKPMDLEDMARGVMALYDWRTKNA
jgi:hypothetical protein